LRAVVDSRIPINLPSKLFEQQLLAYRSIRAAWYKVQESIGSDRPSPETMDQLLANYRRQQRVAYAPAHERAMLLRAYQADIERIDRLKQAVEIGPIIKATLKTPWVVLGIQETLILEIENVGGAIAHQFKLDLGRTSEFELLTLLATHSLGDLAPARRFRLEYRVRAKEPSLTTLALNLNYSYRDHLDQQQVIQETLHLEVRRPRESGIKPKGNRYEVGRPVYGSGNFFGRHDESERILTRLVKGSTQPILLRGPRRIGKTSLLRQIELVLKDRQELQRRRLYSELETQLGAIHPVFVSLQSISQSSQNYVAHFLQTIIEDIYVALRVEGEEQQISQSFERLFPTRAFMKQIDRVFAQRPNERLLVLVDEWDEIYSEEYSELGRNLRFLMQEEQRISWVFSSTWALSKEGGQYGSPFFNTLFTIELTQMDWPSAVRLVNAPSQAVGVTWHGEAVVAALEQTGRRPYLIQLLCSKIIDYLIEKSIDVVDTDTVAIVVNQIITQAHATAQYFGSLWNDESVSSSDKNSVRWMGRLILWTLDASNSRSLTRLEIRNTIVEEFKRHAIEFPDQTFFDREFDDQMTQLCWIFDVITLDNERYTFSIPLVQRWLHQMISQQDDLIDQAHAGLRQDLMKATGTGI
jgi:predicted AAA-ATPase